MNDCKKQLDVSDDDNSVTITKEQEFAGALDFERVRAFIAATGVRPRAKDVFEGTEGYIDISQNRGSLIYVTATPTGWKKFVVGGSAARFALIDGSRTVLASTDGGNTELHITQPFDSKPQDIELPDMLDPIFGDSIQYLGAADFPVIRSYLEAGNEELMVVDLNDASRHRKKVLKINQGNQLTVTEGTSILVISNYPGRFALTGWSKEKLKQFEAQRDAARITAATKHGLKAASVEEFMGEDRAPDNPSEQSLFETMLDLGRDHFWKYIFGDPAKTKKRGILFRLKPAEQATLKRKLVSLGIKNKDGNPCAPFYLNGVTKQIVLKAMYRAGYVGDIDLSNVAILDLNGIDAVILMENAKIYL